MTVMAKLPKFENEEGLIAWIEQNDTSAYMDEMEEAEETFEVIRSMSKTMVAMPVTVEQIASAIKRMDESERERLFQLVTEPDQSVINPTRAETQTAVERIRTDLLEVLGGKPLSPDEPFMGNLTLGQYFDLPDEERQALWDEWAGEQDWIDQVEEVDVPAAPLAAR